MARLRWAQSVFSIWYLVKWAALYGTGEWCIQWVGTYNKVRPTQGSMQKIEMLVHNGSGWMCDSETKYTIMSTMGGWVQVKVHNGTVFLLDIWYL